MIAALPGVGPAAARRIVAERYQRGALIAIEDLISRELLTVAATTAISDVVILLPPRA